MLKLNKIVYTAVVFLVLASAVWGTIQKRSYTNLTDCDPKINNAYVAVLSEENTHYNISEMEEHLSDAPYIAKVKCIGSIEHKYMSDRQLVEVVYVHQKPNGDSMDVKKQVYLVSDHWFTYVNGNSYYTMQRGFVNILQEGETYLVFLEKQIDDLFSENSIYKLVDDYMICPVFHIKDIESETIIDAESIHSKLIQYSLVEHEDFFGETVAAVDEWELLRDKLIKTYEMQYTEHR